MWVEALRRVWTLLVLIVYTASAITAAASPLAACPVALDNHSHAEHGHGATHHEHGNDSTPHPGDCLKCCLGACLLAVSLLPPAIATASSTFYGARIVYSSEEIALANRSIPPDPAPPKPIT